jgi:hypothetical protein
LLLAMVDETKADAMATCFPLFTSEREFKVFFTRRSVSDSSHNNPD